jgi:hypothetical protein
MTQKARRLCAGGLFNLSFWLFSYLDPDRSADTLVA